VHNTAQNSSDYFPSYLQTTVIAQMLSVGGKGWSGDLGGDGDRCGGDDGADDDGVLLCVL